MLENTHDLIPARERLEWSNFWYDDTNKEKEHRILLVGDSTARMVRSRFAEKTGYPVDLLGTSSGLHDILLAKQMDIFFASNCYQYDAIFVQLGHHSRIGESGEPYTAEDYRRFETDYTVLIDYLSQFSKRIILLSIFYSVIPYRYRSKLRVFKYFERELRRKRAEEYDESVNAVKKGKNEIIGAIAQKKGLPYFDVNAYMMNLAKDRKTVCLHTDHVHFEEKAKDVIVEEYCKLLDFLDNEV